MMCCFIYNSSAVVCFLLATHTSILLPLVVGITLLLWAHYDSGKKLPSMEYSVFIWAFWKHNSNSWPFAEPRLKSLIVQSHSRAIVDLWTLSVRLHSNVHMWSNVPMVCGTSDTRPSAHYTHTQTPCLYCLLYYIKKYNPSPHTTNHFWSDVEDIPLVLFQNASLTLTGMILFVIVMFVESICSKKVAGSSNSNYGGHGSAKGQLMLLA